jgi:hypothetical protein
MIEHLVSPRVVVAHAGPAEEFQTSNGNRRLR